MATQVTLDAEKREVSGKGEARKLRSRGRVPAVVYGKDMDTISLSIDATEAEHLFHSISVENTLVDLSVEGEDGPIRTLVREIQVHPVKPELLHVDFYRVREGVRLQVEIPVRLQGIPEGVKRQEGILQQIVHELPVMVLPSKIPESIEIDVTELEMGEAIHVSELALDEDIEPLLDPERTVATVVAPKELVVEEEEEEEELEVMLVGEEGEELPEGELPEGEVPPEGAQEPPEEPPEEE